MAAKLIYFTEILSCMKYASTFLLLIALAFGSLHSQIQLRQEIVELACNADVVVRGKIADVKSFDFEFTPTATILGEKVTGPISVKRFRNTKTAKRWGKYLDGEELLLFLKQDGDKYEILGVNGEGEKLIFGSNIYLDSRGGAAFARYEYHQPDAKTRIYAEKAPLADFLAALPPLRACYEIGYDEKANRTGELELHAFAKRVCSDADFDATQAMSDVALRLIEKAERLVKEE